MKGGDVNAIDGRASEELGAVGVPQLRREFVSDYNWDLLCYNPTRHVKDMVLQNWGE